VTDTSEQIAATIAALEAQRALLGDAVVDTALAPLRGKLAALHAPEIAAAAQQLKQVSVLFVDVVGSTAIGQQLGPEEIHAVMDSALERFTSVVQAHNGRVLQYTGDGMLAAFGTETAAEDDVDSAIRAGLGICEEALLHAPLVRRLHGVPDFNVRAGVHTGRVLLGGGVDAEGSIRGAAVNVAARMEQTAPPGRLRISHDSWRHVHGLFEFEEQPPISVKGIEQPMRSYLVASALPRTQAHGPRGVEGVQTRLVVRPNCRCCTTVWPKPWPDTGRAPSPWSAMRASARAACSPNSNAGWTGSRAGCCWAARTHAARFSPLA
jgi:class 3 adenylate cyclase